MPTKNIFAGQSARAVFVQYVYEALRRREFVSLMDVLCAYYQRDKSYYDLHTYSSDKAYIQLKKAFPEVIRALQKVEPSCVIDNGKKGKGKAFKYIGRSDDPLAAERQALEQKRLEDYVAFCKASAGILPASWFSSYFENTQLLLDTSREQESGACHIRSSLEQNLTNIDLLPVFNKAITDRQVMRFSYQRFGQDPFELTFHPQFLKEYNGRWFVFGEANREPFPLHHTQQETLPFDEHPDGTYGEVTLTIEPNRELRGRILMYGEGLEIVHPLSLREQIREIMEKQLAQYNNHKE